MGRGGAAKRRDGPERRCIATGVSGPITPLIRFVLSPDGVVTPDLAEKLPGRGVWLSADASAVAQAMKKRLFNRAFKAQVVAPDDLQATLERLLTQRAIEAVSLCRKAGAAVAGFERVRDALLRAEVSGPEGAERATGVYLLQAHDGAVDGRRKLARLAPPEARFETLGATELGLAFGRPYVIHALLAEGGATQRALREFQRLDGVRGRRAVPEPAEPQGSGDPGGSKDPDGSCEPRSSEGD